MTQSSDASGIYRPTSNAAQNTCNSAAVGVPYWQPSSSAVAPQAFGRADENARQPEQMHLNQQVVHPR